MIKNLETFVKKRSYKYLFKENLFVLRICFLLSKYFKGNVCQMENVMV